MGGLPPRASLARPSLAQGAARWLRCARTQGREEREELWRSFAPHGPYGCAKELTAPCWTRSQPVQGIVQWMVEREVIQEDQAARLKEGGFAQKQLVLSDALMQRLMRCARTGIFMTCVQ